MERKLALFNDAVMNAVAKAARDAADILPG